MKRSFKQIGQRTSSTTLSGIDHIYLINLDHRPEKLERSLYQLQPFSIRPERVRAIYGWALSQEEVCALALHYESWMDGGEHKQLRPLVYPGVGPMRVFDAACVGAACFYPRTSLGAIGCAMSHLSVLQDAYNAGFETIWVLEDDFRVAADPHALCELIEELDLLEQDWDLFFTDDRNFFNEPFTPGTVWRPDCPSMDDNPFLRRAVGPFFQISGRSQMHSVILRRSGIKKILEFEAERGLFLPYDIDAAFVPGIKMYNLAQEIVWGGIWSQEISDTDYRHFGGP